MTLLSWKIPLYAFLGQTLYTLHKRDQSQCKCFRLFGAQIKIHQILVISETKNKFLFKFCTPHSVHWGIKPPSKIPLPSFLPRPPLNQQTVQAPFLCNPPPSKLIFREPSPKSRIFQWTLKILKFFILNAILSFKGN